MTNIQLTQLERSLLDIVEGISSSLECEPKNNEGEYVDTRANDVEYLAASVQDIAVSIARIKNRRTTNAA